LRSDEKAAILSALNESRGQFNTIRVTPHTPIRGSFATSELITNGTYASGVTGWSASGSITHSVSDRVLRATRNAFGSASGVFAAALSSNVTVTPYVPYVARYFFKIGRGSYPGGFSIFESSSANARISSIQTDEGMLTGATVPLGASANPGLFDEGGTGFLAGDYLSIYYSSFAQCVLIDNAQNFLTRSDEFDHANWTKTRCSASANAATAPDGAVAAENLVEDSTASNTHFATQAVTVSASPLDYSFTVALKAGTRTFAAIEMATATGAASTFIDLSTGTTANTGAATSFSNARTFSSALGNGWYALTVVARKISSETTINCRVYLATSTTVVSYSGNGTGNIAAWRATLAQSAVPTRFRQTTSVADSSGNGQTGSSLHTKGWPVSTNGLLLAGDWFEWNGELKQVTTPVNSDAAGRAYMQFRPGLAGAPADNDPVIVFEPFGRFIYPGTREFENLFGIYGDCEMNLEEIYL
jgi:hypothetical protein